MHEENVDSVDKKIIMSAIICRALFYTFWRSVAKTIKRPIIYRASLNKKTKSSLKLLKDTTL